MNTSSFHQNVGERNKSLNAMSPEPLLSEAFGKGSGCARLAETMPEAQNNCDELQKEAFMFV